MQLEEKLSTSDIFIQVIQGLGSKEVIEDQLDKHDCLEISYRVLVFSALLPTDFSPFLCMGFICENPILVSQNSHSLSM